MNSVKIRCPDNSISVLNCRRTDHLQFPWQPVLSAGVQNSQKIRSAESQFGHQEPLLKCWPKYQ